MQPVRLIRTRNNCVNLWSREMLKWKNMASYVLWGPQVLRVQGPKKWRGELLNGKGPHQISWSYVPFQILHKWSWLLVESKRKNRPFFERWSSKGLGLWTILSSLRPKKKKSLQADCNTVSICSSRIVRCFISSSHLWRGRNMFHFMRTWSQTTALRSPKKKTKKKILLIGF